MNTGQFLATEGTHIKKKSRFPIEQKLPQVKLREMSARGSVSGSSQRADFSSRKARQVRTRKRAQQRRQSASAGVRRGRGQSGLSLRPTPGTRSGRPGAALLLPRARGCASVPGVVGTEVDACWSQSGSLNSLEEAGLLYGRGPVLIGRWEKRGVGCRPPADSPGLSVCVSLHCKCPRARVCVCVCVRLAET